MKPQIDAVCALLRVWKEYLFLQRAPGIIGGSLWQPGAGGKVEQGERKHDAILRELNEELGIRLREHIPIYGMLRHENSERVLRLWVFWCVLGDRPELTLDPAEVRTVRWAPLPEAPEPMTPEGAYLASMLRDEKPTWEGAVWMPFAKDAAYMGRHPRSEGARERSRKLSDAKAAWYNLQAAAGGDDEADRRRAWTAAKQHLTPEQVDRIVAKRLPQPATP